jgi:hypothetical protein
MMNEERRQDVGALHDLHDLRDRARGLKGQLGQAARVLLGAMLDAGAVGRDHAITQADLAERCILADGTTMSARQIQEVNLELLRAGVVVCSTCQAPMGQFIARVFEDVRPFEASLAKRASLIFEHRQALRTAVEVARDQAAAANHGAGTLFDEVG